MTTALLHKEVHRIQHGKNKGDDGHRKNLLERNEHNFAHHAPPNPETAERHNEVRQHCRWLADWLACFVPVSRELSLALTDLEGVMMHANAAIARHPIYEDLSGGDDDERTAPIELGDLYEVMKFEQLRDLGASFSRDGNREAVIEALKPIHGSSQHMLVRVRYKCESLRDGEDRIAGDGDLYGQVEVSSGDQNAP